MDNRLVLLLTQPNSLEFRREDIQGRHWESLHGIHHSSLYHYRYLAYWYLIYFRIYIIKHHIPTWHSSTRFISSYLSCILILIVFCNLHSYSSYPYMTLIIPVYLIIAFWYLFYFKMYIITRHIPDHYMAFLNQVYIIISISHKYLIVILF